MGTVYTIGYTAFGIDEFVKELGAHGITCLIDVRSVPRSGYYTDYNGDTLCAVLKKHGIVYRNYKDEFGARQEDKSFYSAEGYLDFEKFAASERFLSGVKKLEKALSMGYGVCLMCAEKDPVNCHRTILVGRQLSLLGHDVRHILGPGAVCTQADIDARLLDKFFPNLGQMSLFAGENLSREEALSQAYGKRNREIGFRLESEQ